MVAARVAPGLTPHRPRGRVAQPLDHVLLLRVHKFCGQLGSMLTLLGSVDAIRADVERILMLLERKDADFEIWYGFRD